MQKLKIAYGSSCFAKKWTNKEISFDDLCKRLSTTIYTSETKEEYPKLPKSEKDRVKDKGGFVGGSLKGGSRKGENVECRSLLTL
ncbi:MAG: virulence-associated protein E, partial [Anaerococcus obesiensis]